MEWSLEVTYKFSHKKNYFVINIDKNNTKNSYLLKDIKIKNYKFFKIDINSKKIFEIFRK